ncbi:hypothetical protein BH10PSE13_BH10PSE13_08580 [soil metagenome]
MTHIIRLIEDHTALDTCACTLAILTESPSPMPETAFDELQRFRDALNTHLAEEAGFLKGMTGVGRVEFARHAAAHEHRFADLVVEWETYLSEWSEETIGEDWVNFGVATRWMMGRLREQIKAENAILYPLAVQHGVVRLRAEAA